MYVYTHVAISPPLMPNITNLITTPYSVSISWIVTIIVYDVETYTVHYGTDSMTLVDNIVIMGNTDLSAISKVFTVNISALISFTKYYYILSASNSVGTTNTSVMTFMTNETGMFNDHRVCISYIAGIFRGLKFLRIGKFTLRVGIHQCYKRKQDVNHPLASIG